MKLRSLILVAMLCLKANVLVAEEGSPMLNQSASRKMDAVQHESHTEKVQVALRKVLENPQILQLKMEAQKAEQVYQGAVAKALAEQGLTEREVWQATFALKRNFFGSGAGPTAKKDTVLSAQQQKTFVEVRAKALEVKEVSDALAQRNAAKTEEERKEADAKFKNILKEEMIKENKDVLEIIQKIEASK